MWLEENCVCSSDPTTKWERLEEEEGHASFILKLYATVCVVLDHCNCILRRELLCCPSCMSSRGRVSGYSTIYYLTTIVAARVAVCPCVWHSTPRTADVTVTKMAGYLRVRILMNR